MLEIKQNGENGSVVTNVTTLYLTVSANYTIFCMVDLDVFLYQANAAYLLIVYCLTFV